MILLNKYNRNPIKNGDLRVAVFDSRETINHLHPLYVNSVIKLKCL